LGAVFVKWGNLGGIREITSLDKDFDIYRLPGKERIRNTYKP
jgi:hypothetical protein